MSITDKIRLTSEVSTAIIDSFHHLVYTSGVWERTFWRGYPVAKCPSDLFIYQELIYALRPDYIVETGTFRGGSALFFADMMVLNGHGEVISIDKAYHPDRPNHQRVRYIDDDSVRVAAEVQNIVKGKKVIVSLDSDHNKAHVLAEMEAYASMATEYLIVEDTNVNHPITVPGITNGGPMEAVHEFLETHTEFAIDKMAHKFLVTFNPNGWLRRVG